MIKSDRIVTLLQAGGGKLIISDAELATIFVQKIEEVEARKIEVVMIKMKPERDRVTRDIWEKTEKIPK